MLALQLRNIKRSVFHIIRTIARKKHSTQVIRSVRTACNARGSQRGLFPPVASLSSRWAEPNPLHEGVLTVRGLFIWRGIKAPLRRGKKIETWHLRL
ncbi:hypothetical protein Bpfe_002967, partial [Biomphalaria pfeifferi]